MSSTMQIVELRCYPNGIPVPGDFLLRDQPLPSPEVGQVLCATKHLSLDPYMRSQIAGRHLSGAIEPGDTMRGETVSEVIDSRDPAFKPGDLVRCFGGWSSHSLHAAGELTLLGDDFPAPFLALSTLGMPGLTAWAGLRCLAKASAGETVVIPAATGGVGAVAGQLAAAWGCRTIGIVGSEEKRALATAEFGYSHCLNRKGPDLDAALSAACPHGINVYFDLVGGPMLTLASERLAIGARVLLCGLMADYNASDRPAGPPPGLWIRARAIVYGLVVYDFEARRQEFLNEVLPLYHAGKLRGHEEVSHGLDAAPEAFCRLMRGENNGKVIVNLGDSSG